jgi:uncharacterized protein
VRSLPNVVVSVLARVEVPAALWRKQRLGELDVEDVATLVEAFESDWFGSDEEQPAFAIVDLTESVLELASLVVARHALRAYDAVQLASAITAREADPELTQLACFDRALATAARTETFRVLS